MQIADLMERYNLNSRQSLYARFKSLGLSLEKGERGKIDASPEQVELLDELDEHLKKGGSLKSFLRPTETVALSDGLLESDSGALEVAPEQQLLEVLVGAIAANLQPRSPLWYHSELEKAAAGGWLLTGKEVKELIGVKPYCRKGEEVFTRGCWQFAKVGKIGAALAWRVEKV
jgi:hypothetical protein